VYVPQCYYLNGFALRKLFSCTMGSVSCFQWQYSHIWNGVLTLCLHLKRLWTNHDLLINTTVLGLLYLADIVIHSRFIIIIIIIIIIIKCFC